jgi:GxxExxY protein
VRYDGQLIGTMIPDLIVDELVIVDAKVVTAFNETHMAQMLGYLNITGLDLALLINFKYAKLQWKRMIN